MLMEIKPVRAFYQRGVVLQQRFCDPGKLRVQGQGIVQLLPGERELFHTHKMQMLIGAIFLSPQLRRAQKIQASAKPGFGYGKTRWVF